MECWKPCPEEKGIKTLIVKFYIIHICWKPCPEEKGIKTNS